MDGIDKQESIVAESMGNNVELEFMERAIFLFNGEGWARMDSAARKRVMNYLTDRFNLPLEIKVTPFTIPDYTKWISPSTEPFKRIDPLKITCEDVPGNNFDYPLTRLTATELSSASCFGDPSRFEKGPPRFRSINPTNLKVKTDDICKPIDL